METSKNDLQKLLKLIGAFREIEAEMPMQMAQTFLETAMQPGITMQKLGEQLGVSQSSTSRNVQTLGKWHRMGKPGYDLIEAVEDPIDSRRKIMFLTKDGNALVKRLLAILDGEYSADFDIRARRRRWRGSESGWRDAEGRAIFA